MSDIPDAPCSLFQSVIVLLQRRPRKTVQYDIESVDIEDFAQKEMTMASNSSYFGPFLAHALAVKQGCSSKFYSEFSSSGPITAGLFSNTKYGQYARLQMLKITCETSLAKMGVCVVLALSPGLWHCASARGHFRYKHTCFLCLS
jgi:hypothetical protein